MSLCLITQANIGLVKKRLGGDFQKEEDLDLGVGVKNVYGSGGSHDLVSSVEAPI